MSYDNKTFQYDEWITTEIYKTGLTIMIVKRDN